MKTKTGSKFNSHSVVIGMASLYTDEKTGDEVALLAPDLKTLKRFAAKIGEKCNPKLCQPATLSFP